jgi:hypothetical protein
MSNDKKKELKSTGWTGGFTNAPKQKTRRIHPSPTQPLSLDALPPIQEAEPRSPRASISDMTLIKDEETHWYDCFKKCAGR